MNVASFTPILRSAQLAVVTLLIIAALPCPVRAGDREYSTVMAWDKLEVFERGLTGELRQRTFNPTTETWTPWQTLDGPVMASAPSAVLTDGGTRIAVFYRGPDGGLYHTFHDKEKPWSRVIQLGDRELSTGPNAVIAGNVLTVFARGPRGQLMKIHYDKQVDSWMPWSDVE